MFTVQMSSFINRSVEDVFAYATDFSKSQEWQADVIRSEMTSPGPVGVGSTGVFVQKFMGRELANEMEVTAYEPPNRICFKTTSGPVSFEGCQTFEAQDGGTLFTFDITAEGAGFFKVAEGVVKKQLESTFERDLATLKEVMGG